MNFANLPMACNTPMTLFYVSNNGMAVPAGPQVMPALMGGGPVSMNPFVMQVPQPAQPAPMQFMVMDPQAMAAPSAAAAAAAVQTPMVMCAPPPSAAASDAKAWAAAVSAAASTPATSVAGSVGGATTMPSAAATTTAVLLQDLGSSVVVSDGTGSTAGHSSEEGPTSSGAVHAPSRVLRVSGSTPVPGLAGAVANRLREGSAVSAEAMGPASVARMMRALDLAAEFLRSEGLRLAMQVRFILAPSSRLQATDGTYPGLRFSVMPEKGQQPVKSTVQTLNVRESSVPGKSAGAIAKLARVYAPLRRSFFLSMSAEPVAINTGTKALTLARKMLEGDNIDLKVYPQESGAAAAASEGGGDDGARPLEVIVCPYSLEE
eukprot:Rhum_TRINITY_DN9071_c0_g1::Rhum_TRINITY_DN9071_c0_g1_i1::g.31383::m.31383